MSILKIINARLETMSEADRAIGRFIVKHPERMLQLSSSALAAEIGRSQSSVVKFSQKMGYAGYQDLKLAVNRAQAQTWQVPPGTIHGSIESGDSYMTIQRKLVSS